VFNQDILRRVKQVTDELQKVRGSTLTGCLPGFEETKEVNVSSSGIDSRPLMWPDLPKDDGELAVLREKVLQNPSSWGLCLARSEIDADHVDFYDQLVDYEVAFKEIMQIVNHVKADGIHVRVAGEPILYGWVRYFLPETLHIFLITVAVSRRYCSSSLALARTLLPLLAGFISSTWALGVAKLVGFHFDPLVIVIEFLITARSISHSTQLVTRFDDEIASGNDETRAAARISMASLFKPGMLGVVRMRDA